mmetsp:Transcript_17832/g.31224  ORF Transcript_17832/g.31224 Transcript_17832/m.31224 type:complete len:107 (-) Transcript_17832:173-493(-)
MCGCRCLMATIGQTPHLLSVSRGHFQLGGEGWDSVQPQLSPVLSDDVLMAETDIPAETDGMTPPQKSQGSWNTCKQGMRQSNTRSIETAHQDGEVAIQQLKAQAIA